MAGDGSGGGLIASTHKQRQRKSLQAHSPSQQLSSLTDLQRISHDRLDAIDELIEDFETKSLFRPSFADPGQARDATIDALLQMVDDKVNRASSYLRLFGTLFFFTAFVWLLYRSRDISTQYQVERSFLNLLQSTLPSQGRGGYTNSDGGAAGVLQASKDFYSLFSGLVVQTIFSDPICGDGVCDSPDEFPGFGRFGCPQDCGAYINTTTIQINLKDVIGTSSESIGGDVSSIPSIVEANKAGFTYNIWSESIQDFLFAKDQNATSTTVEVPDGKYSLVKYQTKKNFEMLDRAEFQPYRVVPSTIPVDVTKNDYAFGIRSEVIAWSIILTNAMVGYCLYTPGSACSSLSIPDLWVRILNSYGLSGTISTTKTTLLQVPYCSTFPDAASDSSSIANLEFLANALIPCPASQRRTMAKAANATGRDIPIRRPTRPWTSSAAGDVAMTDHNPRDGGKLWKQNLNGRGSSVRGAEVKQHSVEASSELRWSSPAREQTISKASGHIFSSSLQSDYSQWWVIDSGGSGPINISIKTILPASLGYTVRYGVMQVVVCSCRSLEYCMLFPCVPEVSLSGISIEQHVTVKGGSARVEVINSNGVGSICIGWGGDDCPSRPLPPKWQLSTPELSQDCSTAPTAHLISLMTETPGSTWSYTFATCQDGFCSSEPICEEGKMLQNGTRELAYNLNADRDGSKYYIVAISCIHNVSSDYLFASLCIRPPPIVSFSLTGVFLAGVASAAFELLHAAFSSFSGAPHENILVKEATTEQVSNGQTFAVTFRIFSQSNIQAVSYADDLVKHFTSIQTKVAESISNLQLLSYKIDSPLAYLTEGAYPCVTHYDCLENLFCQQIPGYSDFGVCARCNFCTDNSDAFNGACPQDKCPGSGRFSGCTDATKLLQLINDKCSDNNPFEVWSYGPAGRPPQIIPSFQPKLREITKNNRMVGAVVVTQRRSPTTSCLQKIDRMDVRQYAATVDSGKYCPATGTYDSTPYGYDPNFMPFSNLYNPKLSPEVFYAPSERYVLKDSNGKESLSFPKGFYPHEYDQNRLDTNLDGMLSDGERSADSSTSVYKKRSEIVEGSRSTFKLFFDERLTQKQAEKMVTFAQDGQFIDSQTSEVTVEILTYSAVHGMFCYCQIFFTWDNGGNIDWNYMLDSFNVDLILYPSPLTIFLMLFVICALCINGYMETMEILGMARRFLLKKYVLDPFNWIDWLHFISMLGTIITWIPVYQAMHQFHLSPNYPVLFYGPNFSNSSRRKTFFDPPITADKPAQARYFRTVSSKEYEFLDFLSKIQSIASALRVNSVFAGVTVVMFILRLLKSMDFQERMGMVTRTIGRAAVDLFHFLILFGIVLIGFAIVGNVMFGHLYEGMKDLSSSAETLMIILVSFDSTQFYSTMQHAAGSFALQIFIWSYLFIAFFLLMNIFLAILVDAYAAVKEETQDADSLLTELFSVLLNETRARLPQSGRFISDRKLRSLLLEGNKSSQSETNVKQCINQIMDSAKTLVVPGNAQIDMQGLKELLKHCSNPATDGGLRSLEEYNDEALYDLLERYGRSSVEIQERRKEDVKQLVGLESMRRLIAINLLLAEIRQRQLMMLEATGNLNSPDSRGAQWAWSAVELSRPPSSPANAEMYVTLTVLSASNLPKMDVLRKCDGYCMVYVDGNTLQPTYRTETVVGSLNPEWNSSFEWQLYPGMTILTVAVWDRDNLTADDLIGTAFVDLSDLSSSEVEMKLDLKNPLLRKKLTACKSSVLVKVGLRSSSVHDIASRPMADSSIRM